MSAPSARYRHRIRIEEKVQQQNPITGGTSYVWAAMLFPSASSTTEPREATSVPAEVLTGPGRELLAAGADVSLDSARINFAWFPGLDASKRIVWDGNFYNIKAISTDITGRRQYRVICERGGTDG